MENDTPSEPSFIIWNGLKEIFNDKSDMNFGKDESTGLLHFSPQSLRWKNYFLSNMFWSYSGYNQMSMIQMGDGLKELAHSINYRNMDVDAYVSKLEATNFAIYLADSEIKEKPVKEQLLRENGIIVTQNNKVEEFLTTLIAKAYFSEVKGYFVGDFSIPDGSSGVSFGVPDIVGLKGSFVNCLKDAGIIGNGGLLEDLLIWRYLNEKGGEHDANEEAIVSEVKSSKSVADAYEKLYFRGNGSGYLKSHCFDKGYACFGSIWGVRERFSSETDAGALIFCGDVPVHFIEDTIVTGNPSRRRREKSVQVINDKRTALMHDASRTSARLLMATVPMGKVVENVGSKNLNAVLSEVNQFTVENIINKIK